MVLVDFSDRITKSYQNLGIYHEGDLHGRVKDGIKGYLNKYETKLSLYQAAIRWKERKDWTPKIGKPIYALVMYENVLSQLIKFKKQIKDTIS